MADRIIAALVNSLELRDTLIDEERAALDDLTWTPKSYPAGSEIIADGSRPTQSCLLVSGLAGRAVWLEDGGRGLSAVQVPGDFVDLHGLFLKVMDHSVMALTDCDVAFVSHTELQEITISLPHLGRMLSMLVAIDAAIERQWIVGLSRQQAEARIAHMFCELYERLRAAGVASDNSFPFPLSQATLADLAGVSAVHTNRTLQHLRQSGLLTWQNGIVKITNASGLKELAQFDPLYLSYFKEPR